MKRLLFAGLIMTSPFYAPNHPAKAQTSAPAEGLSAGQAKHQAWTHLLARYVRPHEDGVNRFDYGALKASAADRDALTAYINANSRQDFAALTPAERFAALANLYNALTVRLIIDHYPVESIKDIRPSVFAIGPWKQNIVTLNGEEASLDDIEHKMLRPEFNDPRVHYAVNCASIGCPNLRPRAWEAASLDADLDAAARDYINHPRGVSIRADGRLKVSGIYRWYRKDFGGNEAGVIAHLLTYASPELAEQIQRNPSIAERAYDWSLNDVPAGN